jgi:tetratricopeptide (TPR) repeat protein
MPRAILAVTMAAVLAAGTSAAKADEDRDFKTCIDLGTPPQQAIDTCRRLINSIEFLSAGCTKCLARVIFSTGFANHRIKKYDMALVFYNNALRSDPANPQFYVSRGKLYEDTGKRAAAIQDYTKCLGLPAGAITKTCAHNRATVYAQTGNLAAAVRDYTTAIGFDPAFADSYAGRGYANERLGRRQAAIADYRAAIRYGYANPAVAQRLTTLESGAPRPR